MTDSELEYSETMKWMEHLFDGIDKDLDFVNARLSSGALMAYPRDFTNPELSALQARLMQKRAKVVDKMTQMHQDLNKREASSKSGKEKEEGGWTFQGRPGRRGTF
jgi:hypothetical protein